MKRLNTIILSLLALVTGFAVTACSDDKNTDNSALALLSCTPENGASITSEGTVTLTFSKNVRQAAGTTISLNDEAVRVIINGNVVYCHYALPYATELSLNIPAGALTDMDGIQKFEGITLSYPLMMKRKLFDAVVDANGHGDYTTVTDAINAAPTQSTEPYLIFVADGKYNEMISLRNHPYIHLIGQSMEDTRIQYTMNRVGNGDGDQGGATAEAWQYSIKNPASPARQDKYTASNEAVFLINETGGNDFHAENISFINLFGARTDAYGGLAMNGQADAVMTRADRVSFYNCRMVSLQDTWWVRMNNKEAMWNARNYADHCWIEGRTDYLYGNANALVENTTFYNVSGGYAMTAGSHYDATKWGFVMKNCTVDGDETVQDPATTMVSFGRPWQLSPRTVWINTTLNVPIKAGHWDDMSILPKLYAEYNTTYKGQNISIEEDIKKTYLVNGTPTPYEGPYVLSSISDYSYENIIMAGDGWNPKEFYASVPEVVKSSIKLNGTTLSWEGSNTAICYLVFKLVDGKWQYIANTTDSSYEVDDARGTYDVRASNRYGSLSAAAAI